jgi:predicted transcriptional regulator with HTH domain
MKNAIDNNVLESVPTSEDNLQVFFQLLSLNSLRNYHTSGTSSHPGSSSGGLGGTITRFSGRGCTVRSLPRSDWRIFRVLLEFIVR